MILPFREGFILRNLAYAKFSENKVLTKISEFSVLITLVSSQGSDESVHPHCLVRVFTALAHNLWKKMKSQTKIKTSSSIG